MGRDRRQRDGVPRGVASEREGVSGGGGGDGGGAASGRFFRLGRRFVFVVEFFSGEGVGGGVGGSHVSTPDNASCNLRRE